MDASALLSDQQPFLLLAGGVCLALVIVVRLILRRQRNRKKFPSLKAQVSTCRAELDQAEEALRESEDWFRKKISVAQTRGAIQNQM